MACASLAYGDGDGGARTIARRRAAFVRVYGAGRIGACVATFLAASGIGRVSCRDGGVTEPADLTPAGLGAGDLGVKRGDGVARAIARIAPETATGDDLRLVPDLAVLTAPVTPAEIEDLMRGRVPHLAVRADEAIGVVGPLVEPGRSACLRCVNLHKAARDPAWPSFMAPPLSSPSTRNTWSAVRCWISCATISPDRPPIRLPSPIAVRPARPSGSPASFAVLLTVLRGTSSTLPLSASIRLLTPAEAGDCSRALPGNARPGAVRASSPEYGGGRQGGTPSRPPGAAEPPRRCRSRPVPRCAGATATAAGTAPACRSPPPAAGRTRQ